MAHSCVNGLTHCAFSMPAFSAARIDGMRKAGTTGHYRSLPRVSLAPCLPSLKGLIFSPPSLRLSCALSFRLARFKTGGWLRWPSSLPRPAAAGPGWKHSQSTTRFRQSTASRRIQLKPAPITAALISAGGTATVSVRNPLDDGGISNNLEFIIRYNSRGRP